VSSTVLPQPIELRSQLARVSVSAGHYLKFWRCVVKPGIKINSVYYCDNILKQGLLPDIRYFMNFIERWVPLSAGRSACTPFTPCTLSLTCQAPEFTEPEKWPLNSLNLNPVDYSVRKIKDSVSLQNFRQWPSETRDNWLLSSIG